MSTELHTNLTLTPETANDMTQNDMTPTRETSPTRRQRQARSSTRRWAVRAAVAGALLVVLGFGAILLYAKVLNDSPDALGASDLDAALETTGNASNLPAVGGGAWVATGESVVGYRVEEVLFGIDTTAVGRSSTVTGSLTIDGTQVTATDFTVDVATIVSDESRRDNQFHGRIMSADEFPTASFRLTTPIELGQQAVDGVSLNSTVNGELTLRGVTQPVTFDVAAKLENGLIGVQGSIPVVFADYQIANPSFGGITTEDNGLVEFVLVFEPSAQPSE